MILDNDISSHSIQFNRRKMITSEPTTQKNCEKNKTYKFFMHSA